MINLKFKDGIILRKEIFGGIIFNPKKELTIKVDRNGYELLRSIHFNERFQNYYISQNQINKFILRMIHLGVLRLSNDTLPINLKLYESVLSEDLNFLSYPESIHLTITYKCNQHCIACYYKLQKRKYDMSFTLFRKILDESAREGIFQIAIGGGEPFCHPKIWKFLDYVAEKEITTNITTNGVLLNKKQISKLENYDNIGRIQISLDGTEKKIHNNSRQGFNRVIRILTIVSKSKLKFGINILLRNSNIDNLSSIFKMCKQIKANSLNLLRIKPPIVDKNWFKKEKLNDLSIFKLLSFLNNVKTSKTPTIYLDASFSYLYQFKKADQLRLNDYQGCSGGINFLTILPNGDILPCTHLRWVLGNVSSGIKNIWNNSLKLRALRNKKNWIMEPCKSCSILKHCAGCRALAEEELNNYRGADLECLMLRN